MAEKRMFTLKITDSDAFLEMPLSTQALYFHLNMHADDDGFVNNPKKITRYIGAAEDDLKLLLLKRFILGFPSGVIVIKHWKMHNTLKSDRYHPTEYQEELAQLTVKKNKAYTDHFLPDEEQTILLPPMEPQWNQNGADMEPMRNQTGTDMEPTRNQSGSTLEPENRLGLDKTRREKSSEGKERNAKERKTDAFAEFAGDDPALLSTLRDFEKMRNKIKKPMTERAKTKLLSDLKNFPYEDWIAILEQSIFHNWQGIYELKDRGKLQAGKTEEMLQDSYSMMREWASGSGGG